MEFRKDLELQARRRWLQNTVSRPPPLGTVRRRLSMEAPQRPCAVNRFYSSRPIDRNVIVPESPVPDRSFNVEDRSMAWEPGEVLPINPPSPDQPVEEPRDLLSMLQSIQYTMDSNFEGIKTRLTGLETKIKTIEEKQQKIEAENGSGESPAEHHRKKRTPSDLQHQIRTVYGSLSSNFNLDESIDSQQNKPILESIQKELESSDYTPKQIKAGCQTYRKSLRGQRKGRSEEEANRVRIRARQQRLYEKRTKVVKDKELHIWNDVLPSMMSEEEEIDADASAFRRRRQTWKSTKLCRFIDKLDRRLGKKKSSKNNPAKERIAGDTLDVPAPSSAKLWMKITNTIPSEETAASGEDLFSDDESDKDVQDHADNE